MERDFDILVIGELNPDLILSGDVLPEFGQVEKLVDDATLVIGASAAIVACGAARLGLRVGFVGTVGRDVFGDFMLDQLRAHGIDVSGVVRSPDLHTGLSVILNKGNDRAILTFPGAIPALKLVDIPVSLISRAHHLHLASYFIQAGLRPDVPVLFKLAHAHGVTTSLDTNYDPAETWDGGVWQVLENCDVFLPNATEAKAIARMGEVRKAIRYLSQRVPVLAVKLGAEGACTWFEGSQVFVPSLKVEVVDTVGAGDSFDAGFLYGWLAGWDIKDSLRLGCICGSLSTRATGGTAAQPDLAEARRYFA
jgi:sugar/nucleoside kinase (ribokinase family)